MDLHKYRPFCRSSADMHLVRCQRRRVFLLRKSRNFLWCHKQESGGKSETVFTECSWSVNSRKINCRLFWDINLFHDQ